MAHPDRVVFATSVEGLLRTIPNRSPALTSEIRAIGLDPDRIQAAYAYEVFIDLMKVIARDQWPSLDEPAAMFEVGRALMRGYRETLIGRAVTATARLIGPARTLDRFARSLRTANNYTQSTARRLGPQHYELEINPVRFPTYYRGVVLEALAGLGYPETQVTVASVQDETIRLDIQW